MLRAKKRAVAVCAGAVIAALTLPAQAQLPSVLPSVLETADNFTAWTLAGLGATEGPLFGQNPFVDQKANLLASAGDAAKAVVNGSAFLGNTTQPSSFADNTPSYTLNAKGQRIYKPVGGNLDPVDFANFFSAAFANNSVTGIQLTRGTYNCNSTQPSFHITLYCFNRDPSFPFELDFTGSTIYFQNYQIGGFGFIFCQNFYFHGPFNFMYATAALPFSQGTLNSVTPTGDGNAVYIVTTDPGYPTTTTGLGDGQKHLVVPYDSNGQYIVQNSSDIYTNPATKLSNGSYAFLANFVNNIQSGNKLAIRGNAGNHGIFMYKCINFRASYIYLYTAPVFGFLDTFGTNVTINNNVIQPWPLPIPNASGTRPILSTNADAIHSAGARNIGPSILSNQILNPGDDAVAIHGTYYTVYTNDPSTNSLIIFSPNCGNGFCQNFQVGDPIIVYSTPYSADSSGTRTPLASAYTRLGSATITTITLINPAPNGDGSASPSNHPGYPVPPDNGASVYPLVDYNNGYYYRITLDSFPSGFTQATKDSLISNAISNGNNFRVASNIIKNHRARSIHVKASNGIINNNVVQNATIWGMLYQPDLYFLEGDFLQNVTIRNNYVTAPYANVFQVTQNPVDGSIIQVQNSRNITYTSNVFDNAATFAVAISDTNGGAFTSNVINNAGCYPYVAALYQPAVPSGTLVYFGQVSNFTIQGNAFTTSNGCNQKYGNYIAPYYAYNTSWGG